MRSLAASQADSLLCRSSPALLLSPPRQVKILLTNHEHEGHTLAWVLNEDQDPRTRLPTIQPHFCILGKQNRAHQFTGGSDGGTTKAGTKVIKNGTADTDYEGDPAHGGRSSFLGNYCEQVLLPSLTLRKKFDRYGLQREGSGQIMAFTLNCNKLDRAQDTGVDDEHALEVPTSALQHAGSDTGNGVWAVKFNVEASVDFPGDLEPTISSKIAYETMLLEVAERKRKHGLSSLSLTSTGGLRAPGNNDPDFIGHLAHGHEIEFDLPAFVAMLHPMGTTMNEVSDTERIALP